MHICELLPYTAKQMHHLALVRGINTRRGRPRQGRLHHAHRPAPDAGRCEYPHLGSVMRQAARRRRTTRCPATSTSRRAAAAASTKQDAAFLGPQYASVTLGDGKPPANLLRPADARPRRPTASATTLRERLNERFAQRRRTAETEAYTQSYEQAAQLMRAARRVRRRRKEPPQIRDRYGRHEFGRHCLLARRLLENGVTFVKVTHSNYDTHHENFDFHIEQLGEFDRTVRHAARRPGRPRHAREHAGGRDVRVRPHAEDQPQLRPRPLVAGLVGGAGRLRHQGRRRRRQDQRQRHRGHRPRRSTAATCSTPTSAPSASTRRKQLLHQRPADPDGRSRRRDAIKEMLA